MSRTLSTIAAIAVLLISTSVLADQELACEKFTEFHEKVFIKAITANNPDMDFEFLRGEICTNQSGGQTGLLAGSTIGAIAAPLGPLGPLLGLLFSVAEISSSPEPVNMVKVIGLVDGKTIKVKETVGALDDDSIRFIASKFN